MTTPIYPCLWFNNQAEEAANFYCSVFPDSKVLSASPAALMAEINKSKVLLLNGRANFNFTEAVSLVVNCETQSDIDNYWDKLLQGGGKEGMCGWLKDKYGLSWQIVPDVLPQLMSDPSRAQRVTEAFMKMKKFDIETLLKA